jgi:argininosuccinate lyase
LGRSLPFDVRLADEDVRASIAHVWSLESAGILTEDEARRLESALKAVGGEIADGTLPIDDADEDIHSVIERAVAERVGDLGGKLHTGRSRNDLVATDLRLWLLDAGRRIGGLSSMLVRTLTGSAREHAETVMPGTTHGRPAQPITLGHHLLAHAWALLRDLERLDQWSARASVSPLGAGAIATSTLGVNPDEAAERLGFLRSFANSLDAVSDRDFALEFLAVAAVLALHLSRLAADVIRFTDESLGWATLGDAYATGSSMMPNKRNPDVAELARAKAARVAGDFATLAAVLHGLPLGYHRDLQEDKEPVFDAADTLEAVLPALVGAVHSLRFHPDAMRAATDHPELYATDLAESLVKRGVPFREAHLRVGELLLDLAGEKRTLRDLDPDEWERLGVPDGAAHLDPDRSIRLRAVGGGPSPGSVRAQALAIERALTKRRVTT